MSQQEKEKAKRKSWSREETLGFLYCYNAHKEEFYHSRKKKFAYGYVLEDMIAQGFTNSSTTTTALEGKMRTLLVAYKAAKNNPKTSSCFAPFMDAMDEIYGDSPMFCNSSQYNMDTTTSNTTHTDTSDEDKSRTSSFQLQQLSESADEEQMLVPMKCKNEIENSNDDLVESKRKKIWSKEETLGFLYCYHARKDEFYHSRKKKLAYANVLKDMIAQGYTNSSTTTYGLENKMRSLTAAYRAAKENPYRSITSPGIDPYMEEMEEILGDGLMSSQINHEDNPDQPASSDEDQPENSSELLERKQPLQSFDEEQLPSLLTPAIHLSSSLQNPDPLASITFGKRKSIQEIFYEKKLRLKKEDVADKKLMREAKLAQREKFMRESLDALQKKWERDHELEVKKLELLEKLINKK